MMEKASLQLVRRELSEFTDLQRLISRKSKRICRSDKDYEI